MTTEHHRLAECRSRGSLRQIQFVYCRHLAPRSRRRCLCSRIKRILKLDRLDYEDGTALATSSTSQPPPRTAGTRKRASECPPPAGMRSACLRNPLQLPTQRHLDADFFNKIPHLCSCMALRSYAERRDAHFNRAAQHSISRCLIAAYRSCHAPQFSSLQQPTSPK